MSALRRHVQWVVGSRNVSPPWRQGKEWKSLTARRARHLAKAEVRRASGREDTTP